MTTEGQPVTDGRPPLDPLVAAHDKGWSEGYMAGKAAAGLAQGRAEGLDVKRHREAVSRSLRQFGKHPWWPPTIDLSDTILTEYAALTETPVEPVRCKPYGNPHVNGEPCPDCLVYGYETPVEAGRERARVEQAFIDGSVEGSPIDHDGIRSTPPTE